MKASQSKSSTFFRLSASSALICVPILSVFLRVAVALYYGDVVDAPPLLTDQRSYHWLAVRLLEGEGFSFPRAWYPFTPADTPTAHWSFLYSLIVAGVYGIFGAHPLAMRVFQAVAGGILLPWMVYRLTRTLFTTPSVSDGTSSPRASAPGRHLPERPRRGVPPSPSLPLLAAACAAVYGYFILYAATIMTETFTIITLLWSLERALRMAQVLRAEGRMPWSLAAQLGVSLGIATLLRQSILPWVPVLFLWLTLNVLAAAGWQLGTALRRLAPLVLAGVILLACIAPFTVRNARVYGEFLLLNSNTGYAMYSAQHPMHGTRFQEFEAAPVPEALRGLNEAQMDRALLRQGFQFILDDPGRYLLLSLSRVRAYFEFWPTPDSTLLHNLGRTGSFGLFLPFMAYGLFLHLKARRSETLPISRVTPHISRFTAQVLQPASLPLLFAVFYTLMHVFTWAMVRYRLPVDAVLLPFAALAIGEFWTLINADKH